MNPWLPFVAGLIAASPALAQTQSVVIDTADSVEAPGGANLRGLDRINGRIRDFEIAPGETTKFERLFVTLSECRYPSGAVEAEAFGYLTIRDERESDPAFEGWMFASSPALSALDHPRYDVWVLSCKT